METRQMKIFLAVVLMFGFAITSPAKIRVVTTYKYIADITSRIGMDKVEVDPLAKGSRDPHFITPRPSFIAKLRRADLLIINGGQLEVGWLPPVIRQAGNSRINPGSDGLLSLMNLVTPLEKHEHVSRAQGDVHPEGNPHIVLDPHNVPVFAAAITKKLCQLDNANCEFYQKHLRTFEIKWNEKTAQWAKRMEPLQETKIVQYHKLFDYLLNRYHIHSEITLEPLPGIPPTTKHVGRVIKTIKNKNIKLILQDVYHRDRTARFIAGRTEARVVVLPHDVGAVAEAGDIFSLFDVIIRKLTEK